MKTLKNYYAVLYDLLSTLADLDVDQNDHSTIIYLNYDVIHETGQIITHANIGGHDYLSGASLDMLMEYPGTYEDWTDFYMDWDVMDILEMCDFDEPHHVLEEIADYTYKHLEDVVPCDVLKWLEDMNDLYEDKMDGLHEYRDEYIRNDDEYINPRVRLATDLLENYVTIDKAYLDHLDDVCDRIMDEIINRGDKNAE